MIKNLILKQNFVNFLFGFIISASVLLTFFLLSFEGYYINKVEPSNQIIIFLTCLSGAFFEEYIFTYLIFNLLKKNTNIYLAFVITSLFFALLHLGNSHSTYISVISHFFGSCIYIFSFLISKNIFSSIGLHFGWNYTQIFFSLPMSGSLKEGLISLNLPNNSIWFGAAYGIEGGLYSLLLRFVIIIILSIIYVKIKYKPI